MERERRIKKVLYILYSIACAISAFLIVYAATNGDLYSKPFDKLTIKALILGIPAVCCILIDMHYHEFEMVEGPAWATSIFFPLICLLIGYRWIGDKTAVNLFSLTISGKVICVLMYTISVMVSYLAGLWSIFTGDEPEPKVSAPPVVHTTTSTSTTDTSMCGPGGLPIEMGPNYIPSYPDEPGTMCND